MDMKIYLCGPINGCTDAECKDWRAFAKGELHCGVIDPMERDYRGREHEPGIATAIVENDKSDIEAADALLINYVKPSVGTSMEIYHAWLADKPILLVCSEAEKGKLSPWLIYHITAIVHSMREACDRINAEWI